MIRQNIVFVENKAGSLRKVTALLAEKQIRIYGFACFDAPEYALFRMICNDPDQAEQVLSENGYMNRITPVIVVSMKDEVDGLDEILDVMAESNVNLNYIYTSFHRSTGVPVAVMYAAEDMFVTESILKGNGFRVLDSMDELKEQEAYEAR
ncbi:MAG: amino acid-binding protein [Blautia sp.]|nr:amino acid-binding protein [Blautia sp.]